MTTWRYKFCTDPVVAIYSVLIAISIVCLCSLWFYEKHNADKEAVACEQAGGKIKELYRSSLCVKDGLIIVTPDP